MSEIPTSVPHYKHTKECIVPLSTLAESKYHRPFARPDGEVLVLEGLWAEKACSVVGTPIFHRGGPIDRG